MLYLIVTILYWSYFVQNPDFANGTSEESLLGYLMCGNNHAQKAKLAQITGIF